jgi:Fic family protein
MSKRVNNIPLSPDALKFLTEIERFQGVWDFTTTKHSQSFIKSLKRTTIITSSGASTRIEGAILSDQEVSKLIDRGCKITKISSRSEREVAGYVQALQFIYENHSELPISQKAIRELHRILTSQLLQDHLPQKQRGKYKDIPNNVIEKNLETGEEKVWFKTTPPGPQTEAAMFDLVKDFDEQTRSKSLHPLLIISTFIVHFLAIHPFRDGNGRLSRLMTTWLLLRAGYHWAQYSSHEKVIEDNKERYYFALRNTQKTFGQKTIRYDAWLEFFLMVVEKQIDYLRVQITKQSPNSALNDNESRVYELIKEHGIAAPAFIRKHVAMTPDGLRSLLQRLVERKLVQAIGKNRGRQYKIAKS